MTLTINVPDDVAAQFRSAAAAHGQDVAAFLSETVIEIKTIDSPPVDPPKQGVSSPNIVIDGSHVTLNDFGTRPNSLSPSDLPRPTLMRFAGIGMGQPGAILEDAQSYINAMRDEWDDAKGNRDIEVAHRTSVVE